MRETYLVKLHLLKETSAIDIKINSGKNKIYSKKRECVIEGTSKRMTVEKLYNYHVYTKNIS